MWSVCTSEDFQSQISPTEFFISALGKEDTYHPVHLLYIRQCSTEIPSKWSICQICIWSEHHWALPTGDGEIKQGTLLDLAGSFPKETLDGILLQHSLYCACTHAIETEWFVWGTCNCHLVQPPVLLSLVCGNPASFQLYNELFLFKWWLFWTGLISNTDLYQC